jgi:SAM-dependent methyltransferase
LVADPLLAMLGAMTVNDGRCLSETQAFFGPRAAGWDDRFAGDDPRFEAAVAALAPPLGGTVVDAGCGTGRALGFLRAAVGPRGRVVGLDATPEMLSQAAARHRQDLAALVLGDAIRLPLPEARIDAVFAAGLLPHLPDPGAGLGELARVTVPGGRLAIFHPISRAALRARHGCPPTDDDPLSPDRLSPLLAATGWRAISIDDGDDRYLALAERAMR